MSTTPTPSPRRAPRPLVSPRTISVAIACGLVWWPVDQASPIAGAYLAGAALTTTGALAIRDARTARRPRRDMAAEDRDLIGGAR